MAKKFTMRKITAAYIAGFMDGEGTISIISSKGTNGNRYYSVYANVSNTDKSIIHWFKDSFGGYVYEVIDKRKLTKNNWKKLYRWQIYRKSGLEDFLRKIHPYLKIKKRHAEIVLEFIKLFDKKYYVYERYPNGTIKSLTIDPKVVEKRKILHQEIKLLNQRGKSLAR